MGRRDRVFLGVLALAILFLFGLRGLTTLSNGSTVKITVNDRVFGTYDLTEDQEVSIPFEGKTGNVLVISGGEAHMASASCPDKRCVHQGRIRKKGQSIVCLPHRVVVTVIKGEEASIDSMAH